jgi:hypothetical protein
MAQHHPVRNSLALAGAMLCAPALAQPSGWAEGDLRARIERLGEPELKALYLSCCDESERRILDFEEAVRCSIAAEALKRRSFGGDFGALLAWWRLQRGGAAAARTAVGH